MERPTPVLVVTGFLGSGKTTLINRVLAERHGERIAVVVNEFGDVPIDGRLVVSSDEEVVELANGCVCCTVRGDLVDTLRELLARRRRKLFKSRPFERLLIETSGLASPGPVAQTLLIEPELAQELAPATVVALANAERVPLQLVEHPEVEEQVGYADLLLLNHTDRVDEAGLARAEASLRARNKLAPIERTERSAADLQRLFALEAVDRDERLSRLPEGVHGHSEGAGTVVLQHTGELDLHRLKMWLQFLANRRTHELWRLKGILACQGEARPVVVQGVYQWLEIGPGEGEPPERSSLVLIGRDLDEEELRRGWSNVVGATG